jgi:hypothetical protein
MSMGTMFANAPIAPTVTTVQVLQISFETPCRHCRRRATTSIRSVDAIGSPMVADLYVCDAHANHLVARARAKNIEVSKWPPRD